MNYGVAGGRIVARSDRGVIAIGDVIGDAVFERDSLNAFMAQGVDAWRETAEALRGATAPPIDQPVLTMPFEVADYVDFYSSIHHATNLGRLFGLLLNDWSARDIQSFEYQPLGPMLGKSFLTSISAWVVPFDDLRPFLVPSPPQEPEPDAALRGSRAWGLNLNLAVERNGTTISCTNFADMYWTFAQQLAHTTSNGAATRSGDLFASGTVSGATANSVGSLIESGGPFLADDETVTLRGWCEDGTHRVGFGEVTGTITAARR